MSVILYARVSTGHQAEKELSIPAQLRTLRQYASERHLEVSGVYQDVSSGCALAGRVGLVAALRHAAADKAVRSLLVHKVDRLSRNTYQYLALKGQLRSHGVSIVSVVEHFEDNPMGEFIEHIMAAQAEFYSANLSFEVKKGLEERRRQGKWSGTLPLGYIKDGEHVRLDPARAHHVRYAFERWGTGQVTSTMLADELRERGLVGRYGKPVAGTKLCGVLKNPFYSGVMRTATGEYAGVHPPLITRELFARCQEVFVQKGKSGKPRQHLCFLLAGLLRCPNCDACLVGEQHVKKKSGKVYRYYRCHRRHCSFTVRAEALEYEVKSLVAEDKQLDQLGAMLRREQREAARHRDERHANEVRSLRGRVRELDEELRRLARQLAEGNVTPDNFEEQRRHLQGSQNVARWMLARQERAVPAASDVHDGLGILNGARRALAGDDHVEQCRVLRGLLQRVDLKDRPVLVYHEPWRRRLETVRSYRLPGKTTVSN